MRNSELVGALIRLCRVRQWTKNALVFAGLVFAQRFTDLRALGSVLLVFAGFCLLSSGLYVVNDVLDVEEDRRSERKRERPLASGAVPVAAALALALGLAVPGLILTFIPGVWSGLAAVAYAVVVMAYSAFFKHIVVMDVLLLAGGFVLRAVAGALAIPVFISPWLLICTLLLALFLALGKRRQELVLAGEGHGQRPVLLHYSADLLDQMITIVASATLVAYCVYTANPETISKFHTTLLPLTIPFVMYGLFRYLYLVHQHGRGHNPSEVLLTDVPLLVDVVLWGACCIGIILLGRI